ncbi:unnamed protein product [Caenorhabditis nigoni]
MPPSFDSISDIPSTSTCQAPPTFRKLSKKRQKSLGKKCSSSRQNSKMTAMKKVAKSGDKQQQQQKETNVELKKVEPPKNRKFGLLKCPFALREQIVRNMEFMDAFHFSTLSKRSKRLVHDAKLRAQSISFDMDISDDLIIVKTKDRQRLTISLSNSTFPPKRDSNSLDGLELANLINEPSEDYRKKLSAHLLFIFPFEETSVYIERRFEPLTDCFLWDAGMKFDLVSVGGNVLLSISSENLKFILETMKSKEYYLCTKISDDSNFKYQKPLDCEELFVSHGRQWLDTDDFLKRNPKMKRLNLLHLRGEQINDLLKQWINGEVTDLETMTINNFKGYPDDVVFDGIVTMQTKLTKKLEVAGRTVDIRRKTDGRLATVRTSWKGCRVEMWNEERLDEVGN